MRKFAAAIVIFVLGVSSALAAMKIADILRRHHDPIPLIADIRLKLETAAQPEIKMAAKAACWIERPDAGKSTTIHALFSHGNVVLALHGEERRRGFFTVFRAEYWKTSVTDRSLWEYELLVSASETRHDGSGDKP